MKSWKKPTSELIDKALGSFKKEHHRKYFFLAWKIRCGLNLLRSADALNTLQKPSGLMMARFNSLTGPRFNISGTCVVRCLMKLSSC